MDPVVCLLATHWTPTFENCRRSLNVNNFNYSLIGWGESWQNWMWRVQLYVNFLKIQDPNQIVIFLDAFDAIATRQNEEFLNNFLAFSKPVVVGSEWFCGSNKNCGIVKKWWKKNDKRPAFRSRINAGCVIGYANKLLEIYSWILNQSFDDDQKALASWINEYGTDCVAIDTGSILIYNVNVFDGFQQNDTAFFHHFPGPLLKHGLFPQYNTTVRRKLKFYARYSYPKEYIYNIFYLLAFMMFFVMLRQQTSKTFGSWRH